MSTLTAWRFSGTEGADEAVLRLQQLNAQNLIDVQDAAIIRWPQYAAAPTAQEHVTADAGKVSGLVRKLRHSQIESALVESVKGEITPGTSVLVLLSDDAEVGTVAKAFEGQDMELMRSDLSVPEQDQVRAAFGDPAKTSRTQPPGETPQS